MENYTVTKRDLGPLTRSQTALYRETCVVNTCEKPITLIESDGTKTEVPPSGSDFSIRSVLLHKREIVGSSATRCYSDDRLPGFTIEIPYFRLNGGPIYVKEFNIVVCRSEDADSCRHPFAAMKYTESVDQCLKLVADQMCDAPGMRILANDPTDQFDMIYTLINSRVISIPVTHISDDGMTLTLVIIDHGKYYADVIDIDELKSGTTNTIEFEDCIIPFITTSKVNAESMAKAFQWLTPKAFALFKEKEQQRHEAELAAKDATFNAYKSEKEAKIKELTAKLTINNTTLAQVQSERDDYKYRYQYLKGDINATSDMMGTYRDKQKMETDISLSRDSMEISRIKRKHTKEENTFKTWHLIAAAAIPAVVGIGVELFRKK
jgi:hypothetical protein